MKGSTWTNTFERNQVDRFFFEDDDVAAVDVRTGEWMLDQVTLRSDGWGSSGASWHVSHITAGTILGLSGKGLEFRI